AEMTSWMYLSLFCCHDGRRSYSELVVLTEIVKEAAFSYTADRNYDALIRNATRGRVQSLPLRNQPSPMRRQKKTSEFRKMDGEMAYPPFWVRFPTGEAIAPRTRLGVAFACMKAKPY